MIVNLVGFGDGSGMIGGQQLIAGDFRIGRGMIVAPLFAFSLIAHIRHGHGLVARENGTIRHDAADAHIQRTIDIDGTLFTVRAAEYLFHEEMRGIKPLPP